MPRPKKINTENKTAEKPKRKSAQVKKVNTESAEATKPVAENIYSTLRTDSNGVKELVIDWDKLREHVRHSV